MIRHCTHSPSVPQQHAQRAPAARVKRQGAPDYIDLLTARPPMCGVIQLSHRCDGVMCFSFPPSHPCEPCAERAITDSEFSETQTGWSLDESRVALQLYPHISSGSLSSGTAVCRVSFRVPRMGARTHATCTYGIKSLHQTRHNIPHTRQQRTLAIYYRCIYRMYGVTHNS